MSATAVKATTGRALTEAIWAMLSRRYAAGLRMPSRREMVAETRASSVSQIHYHLLRLERLGYIERRGRRTARGIVVRVPLLPLVRSGHRVEFVWPCPHGAPITGSGRGSLDEAVEHPVQELREEVRHA